MRWPSNEATVGSNPDGFIFLFLSIFLFNLVSFALLKVIFIIFFSVINAFHNPENYSTVKLCVLIIKKVINTRIRTRPVCSFAQFMLLNIMPKFALNLFWIHIFVPDQW